MQTRVEDDLLEHGDVVNGFPAKPEAGDGTAHLFGPRDMMTGTGTPMNDGGYDGCTTPAVNGSPELSMACRASSNALLTDEAAR